MFHMEQPKKQELTLNQRHYWSLQGSIQLASNNAHDPYLAEQTRVVNNHRFLRLCAKLRRN